MPRIFRRTKPRGLTALRQCLLGLLCSTLVACGSSSTLPEERLCSRLAINGGEECRSLNIPLVKLQLSSIEGRGSCSGFFFTPHSLLTAAHCVDGILGLPIVEFADGSSEAASSIAIHPRYFSSTDASFDLAVVRIENDIREKSIQPLNIVTTQSSIPFGETLIVYGFGGTEQDSTAALPRAALVTAESNASEQIFLLRPEPSSLGGSTCPGDSGGAVVTEQGNEGEQVLGLIVEGEQSRDCDSDSRSLAVYLGAEEVGSFLTAQRSD